METSSSSSTADRSGEMSFPRFTVDLSESPDRRWRNLAPFASAARRLLSAYADLPQSAAVEAGLDEIEHSYVSPEHVAELSGIATVLGVDRGVGRRANYHYDGMKLANSPPSFACTAIAIATPDGPLHARNLDWFTSGGLLAKATVVVDFVGGLAGDFTLVTWPGFAGALSAIAPGRFAITLNFVVSGERFQPGAPAVFALRHVLETCPSFAAARDALMTQPLVSDALLLLTGIAPDDRIVIERTPARAAQRTADGQAPLVVTNDYRALASGGGTGTLSTTSCGRYDRALELAPRTFSFGDALAILEDDQVRMGITAQHMVMQASSGRLEVKMPVPFRTPHPQPTPPKRGLWARLLERFRGYRGGKPSN